ncbi:MAG: single-stranded DNA-binding protein [Leptospirales bacterium]|nr:single-stranded DNA-binding protein [Leptospirales bacterium]
MASDLNRVVLVGRLTRDPELKSVGSGSTLCKFGIANNRSYTTGGDKRDEVNFFNCTAWGKQAEILGQYARKGKQLAIEGRLQYRSWDGSDGKKQSAVDIIVENFQFLGSRDDGGGSGSRGSNSGSGDYPQPSPADSYGSGDFPDDDIPF